MTKATTHSIYESNVAAKRIQLDTQKVGVWFDLLFSWLFGINNAYEDAETFQLEQENLDATLKQFLIQTGINALPAEKSTRIFFEKLSKIHELLTADIENILQFDPAAKSKGEILLAYPGFFAVAAYRISNALLVLEIPVLPRVITEYAHGKTGIDIHPGATVGERLLIDHGTGIVIGETAVIGDDVKIYQGVTIGALSVSKDKAKEKRHPTIEDQVIIYANATILGGNTTIGRGSVIGGNVWITTSIPAQSVVFHKNEIIVKDRQQFPEALNFSI